MPLRDARVPTDDPVRREDRQRARGVAVLYKPDLEDRSGENDEHRRDGSDDRQDVAGPADEQLLRAPVVVVGAQP